MSENHMPEGDTPGRPRPAAPSEGKAPPPKEPACVAPGIWRWERRHPEWHPGAFGATVASYAVDAGGITLLIDPLVEGDADPVLSRLDLLLQAPVRILITIPYHTRSAEALWLRYRERDARIHGHALVAKRLSDRRGFREASPGDRVDGVAVFHPIGRPVRSEMPVAVPDLGALAFGDVVVEMGEGLRVWDLPLGGERRRRWYEDRLLPTLRALTDLEPTAVLVTHGRAVVEDAAGELRTALELPPWQRPRHRSGGASPLARAPLRQEADDPRP
jgi:hypothetical protein